jgi:Ca2+-binding RTX toxin-like protein
MRKILIGVAAFGTFFAAGAQPAFGQTLIEDVVDVLPISDLSVELNDQPDPVGVDTTLTYKVSLKNGLTSDIDSPGLLVIPPRDATVRVETRLAPTLENIQAEASEGGECDPLDPGELIVTCRFDNLEGGLLSPGERARIEITATPTEQGFVRANTRIDSSNIDLASGGNEDREGTQVVPSCEGKSPTVVGTGGPDVLMGTTGKDVFVALGGDDVIDAFDGNDVICAGDGDDRVKAGGGADRGFGQAGDDFFDGSGGNDFLEGNAGNDRFEGAENDDEIRGGVGADNLAGQGGNDDLFGEGGPDRLFGGPGNDVLNGGADNDTCSDSSGSNTFTSC